MAFGFDRSRVLDSLRFAGCPGCLRLEDRVAQLSQERDAAKQALWGLGVKIAEHRLIGYREFGAKCAALQKECDTLRKECAELRQKVGG